MADAFAEATDLALRLNRSFSASETAWIDELLVDASAHLRFVIGQKVYPETVSAFTAYPDRGRVDLPQWPVVSVDTVQRDSAGIDYTYRPGYIEVCGDDPVEVAYTWGYNRIPAELKRLACVLVSQTLLPLEAQLGLTAGGLSSVALDDFKLAWADAGASSGMNLTPHAESAVRDRFGKGGSTVAGPR